MRTYQRKTGQHTLPHAAYMATVWTIRDYYRHKIILEDKIGLSAVVSDGQPHGRSVGDPTFRQAADIYDSYAYRVVSAVDRALQHVPEDMRAGVVDSVMTGKAYPPVPSARTWGREKARFVYLVYYLLAQSHKDGNTGQSECDNVI